MSNRRSRRRWKERGGIRRLTAPGASPGTLVADPHAPRPVVRILAYGPDTVVEQEIRDLRSIRQFLGHFAVTWINVDGLGEAAVIAALGELFGLHRLALEDVLHVHQRPKVELYDDHYYIVGRMVERGEGIGTEQLSLFLGRNFVLTFQERPGDCFNPVRERIRKKGGRVRQSGPDYLAYALIDALIDDYFPVLEECGETLETLEDDVIARPEPGVVSRIHQAKRDLLMLRRAVWPLREAVNGLVREASPLISEETRIYLRDCYDHTIQVIDVLENYRDIASSLMEAYLSSVSNRLNEIMKVLTIFTTIFIPLTLISGIYGMNFNAQRSPFNMPELNWYLGYPFALASMAVVAAIMLAFFRRKGWIGSGRRRRSAAGGRDSTAKDHTTE